VTVDLSKVEPGDILHTTASEFGPLRVKKITKCSFAVAIWFFDFWEEHCNIFDLDGSCQGKVPGVFDVIRIEKAEKL
jgi:hypothetical protein